MSTHWRGSFVVVLSIPTTVKVAEIAPWIHHSLVKPASLEWEFISDPASLCRITLQHLSTLPRQDSTSQDTTGDQEWQDDSPALVTPRSWLVYSRQKLESTLQWDKHVVFHTSYLTVMHCHPLSVSVAVVLILVFTISLAETTPPPQLVSWWKVFICSPLSLLSRMHNCYLLLLISFNKEQNTQPSFTRRKLPLTAPVALVTL
jgi:hypothetical protein